jgi:hypothetical protein
MYGIISGFCPRKKFDINDVELSASRSDRFTFGEIFPDTNWIGGWECPSACLDAVE